MFSALATSNFTDLEILIGTAVLALAVGLAVYVLHRDRLKDWKRRVERAATTHGAALSPWPEKRGSVLAWTHWGVTVRLWLHLPDDNSPLDSQLFEIIPPGGLPPFSARVRLSNNTRTPGLNPAFEQRFTIPKGDHAALCSVLSEPMQAEFARLAGSFAYGEIRSDGHALRWRPGVDILDELPAALQLLRVLAERLASQHPHSQTGRRS